MAEISVIVPVYKVEKYLQKCVDSILTQTFTDFELILVDDGTPDKSADICDENTFYDSKIVAIHKKNGGQAAARNYALDVAHGKFVGFVDSDDTISAEMYEKLHDAVVDCKTIVMCGRYDVDKSNEIIGECFTFEKQQVWDNEESMRRFLTWNGLDSSSWDKLISREMIGENRYPRGYICEDIPFIFEIITKSKQVINIGEPLYHYYLREGSTSRPIGVSKKTEGFVKYNRAILLDLKDKDSSLIPEAEYFYLYMALYYHNFLKKNSYYKEYYKNNRKGIIAEKKYVKDNPYLIDYQKKALRRIASFYYPIYRKIKDMLLCVKRL